MSNQIELEIDGNLCYYDEEKDPDPTFSDPEHICEVQTIQAFVFLVRESWLSDVNNEKTHRFSFPWNPTICYFNFLHNRENFYGMLKKLYLFIKNQNKNREALYLYQAYFSNAGSCACRSRNELITYTVKNSEKADFMKWRGICGGSLKTYFNLGYMGPWETTSYPCNSYCEEGNFSYPIQNTPFSHDVIPRFATYKIRQSFHCAIICDCFINRMYLDAWRSQIYEIYEGYLERNFKINNKLLNLSFFYGDLSEKKRKLYKNFLTIDCKIKNLKCPIQKKRRENDCRFNAFLDSEITFYKWKDVFDELLAMTCSYDYITYITNYNPSDYKININTECVVFADDDDDDNNSSVTASDIRCDFCKHYKLKCNKIL